MDWARADTGTTPLVQAAEHHADMVDLLLEHHADVEKANQVGFTPVARRPWKSSVRSARTSTRLRTSKLEDREQRLCPQVRATLGHLIATEILMASSWRT